MPDFFTLNVAHLREASIASLDLEDIDDDTPQPIQRGESANEGVYEFVYEMVGTEGVINRTDGRPSPELSCWGLPDSDGFDYFLLTIQPRESERLCSLSSPLVSIEDLVPFDATKDEHGETQLSFNQWVPIMNEVVFRLNAMVENAEAMVTGVLAA